MFEKVMVMIAGRLVPVLIENGSSARPPCFVVGLSSHYHDKFSARFRSFYQLVLIDLYWTDSRFSAEYINKLEFEQLSEHIEQVREQLQDQCGEEYRQIFVLGHSAYGFISLDYGLRYPEKVIGVINIASPLIFDDKLATQWQEEYIDSNFGSSKAGGPTPRRFAYYQKKAAFLEEKPAQTKHYFVKSYLSKGPLFFNNPVLWQNQQGEAERMWEPWEISVVNKETKQVHLEKRDLHMPMLFRYIALVTNKDCYSQLSKVSFPLLWVIALGDLRVSLYQLEDKRALGFSKKVEFFHPANASHWPMLAKDTDPREFDDKAIHWGKKALVVCYQASLAPSAKL